MAAPTRAEIVADATLPTYTVEWWNGSAWVAFDAAHVISLSPSLQATGGEPMGTAMGPSVQPSASVDLAAASWALVTDRTPVRISYGFASSDKLPRFAGPVVRRSRGPDSGTLELGGWDRHIAPQPVRSPLFYRRVVATATTVASLEDTSSSVYAGGMINYVLWECGGRPYEQAGSYPGAVFYYSCTQALIAPEWDWCPGGDLWAFLIDQCRIGGGQIYQDGDGVVRYVDPITLASGTPAFTFSDEVLTAAQRVSQAKSPYADFSVDISGDAAVTGVSCTYVDRRIGGSQVAYEDTNPHPVEVGATLSHIADVITPLYSVQGVEADVVITRMARKAVAGTDYTISYTFTSAQRVTVTIVNLNANKLQVDAIRVRGRPLVANEDGSASYIVTDTNVIAVDDSPYVQTYHHAMMLCRMLYDAGQAGGTRYTLTGCRYDPDRYVGEVVGLTSSHLGLTALRCRVVEIQSGAGDFMDVQLVPLAGLPTSSDVHLVGSISGTKALAY